MSGGYVSYSIRPSKTVERLLFVELLSRVDRALPRPMHQYCYIGLGGPFLDDFRLMYAEFAMRQMISIERDPQVHRRQQFNKPFGHIQCLNVESGEFIDDLETSADCGQRLLWLDYTEAGAGALRRQIQEIETLLPKLAAYDIVKVTLNANPSTLGNSVKVRDALHGTTYLQKLQGEELQEHRLSELRAGLEDKLPGEIDGQTIDSEHLTHSRFPRLVLAVIEQAAYRAMRGTTRMKLQPLASYAYADTHQMITFTGIMLPGDDVREFFRASDLKAWKLAQTDWSTPPIPIRVPFMSMKERNRVDSLLHRGRGKTLQRHLRILLQETEEESAAALDDYKKFNRQYSHFVRALP